MVERVAADQYVTPRWRKQFGQWRPSLVAVERHRFLPDTIWVENPQDGPPLVALHRQREEQRWLERVYGDLAVIAQGDDGDPGSLGWAPTSSASSPVIVAVMLCALDAHLGHRVLEIGTGTGYHAAVLAHRLGAQQVTTIEIDPDMATHARQALAEAGFGAVTVITGDGEQGHPPAAPYDRVIATAECTTIPYSWVAQTRPGGRILTPWSNSYFNGGLVALSVSAEGTATGSIVDRASFMRLKGHRDPPREPVLDIVGEDEDRAHASTTDLHPYRFIGDYDAQLAISLHVPGCEFTYVPYNPRFHEGVVWFTDRCSRSWASHTHHTPEVHQDEYPVLQFGPRRLWDEIHAAYHWWEDAGQPPAHHWQFTITPDHQHVELPTITSANTLVCAGDSDLHDTPTTGMSGIRPREGGPLEA
jgi:protein-L-isoaspartate(D-aspartate) O-methyltransferase